MRFLFIILLFISFNAKGQTFFGVAAVPTDNSTNATTTITITPPGSMQDGDLVFVYAYQRGTATMSVTTTGGQTWNTWNSHTSGTATLSAAGFWCRFNGTWGASPIITFTAGTNTNAVMLVFRPNTSTNVWTIENAGSLSTFAATGFPALSTSSVTTTHARTVTIAIWSTDDDNTWSISGSPSGWSKIGLTAQYRNTSGSDASSQFAYNIQTTTTTLTDITGVEATNGNDPGISGYVTFYEDVAPSGPTRRVTIIQ